MPTYETVCRNEMRHLYKWTGAVGMMISIHRMYDYTLLPGTHTARNRPQALFGSRNGVSDRTIYEKHKANQVADVHLDETAAWSLEHSDDDAVPECVSTDTYVWLESTLQ
jgi:hypothetical protein